MTQSFRMSPHLRQPLFWSSISLLMALVSCHPPANAPLDESATLATFKLPSGFRVELVAAEPLAADSVAMED